VSGARQYRRYPKKLPGKVQAPYFNLLSASEQTATIRRLAASGVSEATIAGLTGASLARIQAILQ
jgi:hypothetical protein